MHGLALPDPGEPLFCGRCAHPLEATAEGGRLRPRCARCGWTYYAKPALGAAVLIEDEGRILLVQRAHEPYRAWWMLPAGFVEYGEDASETAAREAVEETGLLVEITGLQGLYSGGGDPRGASHLAVFAARRLGGTLRAADDAAAARWFAAPEVPDNIAFEAQRQAIAEWIRSHDANRAAPSLMLFAGTGPAPPIVVYAVIENPMGTVDRIVYDGATSSFVPSGEVFAAPLPIHYGWIPHTLSQGDNRELDVVVAGEGDTSVGSVIPVRPIGALLRGDGDHKVVAVRCDLPSIHATAADIAELPQLREMVEGLFRPRARLLGWASAADTRRLILDTQRAWIRSREPAGGAML